MSKILVLKSRDRFALMISRVLSMGLVRIDSFECPPALDLRLAIDAYAVLDRDEKIQIDRMAGTHVTMDPEDSPGAANDHLDQYVALQEFGGHDFWDRLLAGSQFKLKAIRDGNERALHGEMTTIWLAHAESKPSRSGHKMLSGWMFGVDVDAARMFYYGLDLERRGRMDTMVTRLVEKADQDTKPKRTKKQTSPASFPAMQRRLNA